MEVSVPLPLDSDGFIRRECPKCGREFKWHYGPMDDRPEDLVDPPVYTCPLCGQSSNPSDFITEAQADFATRYVMLPTMEELEAELKGSGFKFEITNGDAPDPLVEPDDMVTIAPPCHPWEPVKVPVDSQAPYYCLICGEPYAV